MIFYRFLAHDFVNILFPLVLCFAEFVDAFTQRAEEFWYFLCSEEKEDDKKDKYDFPAAEVSDEGKVMCWSDHSVCNIVLRDTLGNFFVRSLVRKKKRVFRVRVVLMLPVWACLQSFGQLRRTHAVGGFGLDVASSARPWPRSV